MVLITEDFKCSCITMLKEPSSPVLRNMFHLVSWSQAVPEHFLVYMFVRGWAFDLTGRTLKSHSGVPEPDN